MSFIKSISFAFFLLIVTHVHSACGEAGQTISIASEADFDLVLGCDSILGSLFISDGNISFLNQLSSLTYVAENLIIDENISLLGLNGLENLTYVGGNLEITTNFSLIDLEELTSLAYIGGNFYLSDNFGLDNFIGMENLTEIDGNLHLEDNNFFENFDGLTGLISIGNNLIIGQGQPNLSSLQGLSSLTNIGEDFQFFAPSFSNLNGLESLTDVGGNFKIDGTGLLSNINGLSGLTNVGGNFELTNNSSLLNLNGLFNLESVGAMLIISDNENLSNCCGIKPFLEVTTLPIDQIVIENNDNDCNTIEEILECIIENVEEIDRRPRLNLYPIPNRGEFIAENLIPGKLVTIYDIFGRIQYQTISNSNSEAFSLSLSAGQYVIEQEGRCQLIIISE